MASSHQHGGGKYQTLEEPHVQAPAVQGARLPRPPNHVYNTIRPILHEPGPIGTGAYATAAGHPDRRGRGAAARRRCTTTTTCTWPRWASGRTWFVKDDSVEELRQDAEGHRRDQPAQALRPHARTTTSWCRSCPSRAARSRAFDGSELTVGDDFFRPGRITAKVGQPVTWRFGGSRAALGHRGKRPARVLVRVLGRARAAPTPSRRRSRAPTGWYAWSTPRRWRRR